jgi:hypothetical protein
MTVPSGRARFGARSVLRAAFVGAAAILGLFGCGNNQFINGTPIITFSVTPGPFTSYLVEIDQIMLTRSDNTPVYPLLQPQLVDFTKLADMPEVFGTPAILEGTYTSAAITVNYGASLYQTAAQIFINQNGVSVPIPAVDSTGTGTAAGSVTYTVKFDPAHPLVIKRGVSTPLDFNFDLSASTIFNVSATSDNVVVRPFISASTLPQYKKPLRARGVYVTTDTTNNNNFTMNARSFFDVQGSPVGAIEVQTNDNTTYNINGVAYKGAAGLAAVNALQINTIIEAYGTYGDLNNIKPNLVATEVYAGVAVENPLTDRITGTIASRSGNTLHIRGAEVEARNFNIPIGVAVSFQNDLTLTIGDTTLITVDGHPELQAVPLQYLSIGQQVDIEAVLTVDASSNPILDANGNLQWNATSGLIRLVPTTGWGVPAAATAAGSIGANLLTLGGFQPAALTFTGTGSATGEDSNPAQYQIATPGVDTSAIATAPLFRFDGVVNQFGTAPPDFTASSVTAGSATDQIMTVEWTGSGTTAPFVTKDANGLVVSVSGAALGGYHFVQTGPLTIATDPSTTVDLATLSTNPTIVADPSLTSQFAIGNPTSTTGLAVFHDYASFLTQLNTALNGTNTILKLVAVGKYDQASNTFTAYRIDLVQLP